MFLATSAHQKENAMYLSIVRYDGLEIPMARGTYGQRGVLSRYLFAFDLLQQTVLALVLKRVRERREPSIALCEVMAELDPALRLEVTRALKTVGGEPDPFVQFVLRSEPSRRGGKGEPVVLLELPIPTGKLQWVAQSRQLARMRM